MLIACHRSLPLGMMNGDIQDWQISASSTTPADWDKGCHERFARLYNSKGRSWCAKYKAQSEWLQIDLGVASKVSSLFYCIRLNYRQLRILYDRSASIDPGLLQPVTMTIACRSIDFCASDSTRISQGYNFSGVIMCTIDFNQTVHELNRKSQFRGYTIRGGWICP